MKKTIRTFTIYKGNVIKLNKKVKLKNKDKTKKRDITSNPALLYLKDCDKSYFIKKPVRIVYDDYKNWCEINSVHYSENMIRNTIIETFEMKTKNVRINGIPTRCFTHNDED